MQNNHKTQEKSQYVKNTDKRDWVMSEKNQLYSNFVGSYFLGLVKALRNSLSDSGGSRKGPIK